MMALLGTICAVAACGCAVPAYEYTRLWWRTRHAGFAQATRAYRLALVWWVVAVALFAGAARTWEVGW